MWTTHEIVFNNNLLVVLRHGRGLTCGLSHIDLGDFLFIFHSILFVYLSRSLNRSIDKILFRLCLSFNVLFQFLFIFSPKFFSLFSLMLDIRYLFIYFVYFIFVSSFFLFIFSLIGFISLVWPSQCFIHTHPSINKKTKKITFYDLWLDAIYGWMCVSVYW